MRILHIMASKALGGAETYSTDVMLSLHKAGIDQCVAIPKEAPRYVELHEAGIRLAPWVYRVPTIFAQKFLLRWLAFREKPDFIHCWMRRGAELTRMLPKKRPLLIGWFGGYYDPTKFVGCTEFVGVTKEIVIHMEKNGVAKGHAHFIPTFPDVTPVPPIDRSLLATDRHAKVLLTLSRLHPKKGLDILLTALKELPECVAWLAGDGPLRRELEVLATKLGVLDRVRFLGWRSDRAALLRAADICVLPSRYEPFGTVILEAWAAGTPLVACASAGPAATIENDVSGLLTPINDAPALKGALRRLLDDENLRRKFVAQGYAAYIKDYTREAVTLQWIKFYKRLLPQSE